MRKEIPLLTLRFASIRVEANNECIYEQLKKVVGLYVVSECLQFWAQKPVFLTHEKHNSILS